MEENAFIIDNDKKADWAITQIKDAENECERLITLAEEQIADLHGRIEELKAKCDNETAYLKSLLDQYFRTVPHKETKTQETYKLLSGTLVMKKPSVKINHDDEKLIEYLENNDGNEYIKLKKSVDWAEFKKNLTVLDSGEIVDSELGTVIDSAVCSLEEVPASFNIKY